MAKEPFDSLTSAQTPEKAKHCRVQQETYMHQQILKSNMVIQQQERAKHMETIATVLGIISSMLSIFATATSIKNKKEIKKNTRLL
ncbi:hypothetical protein LF912_02415 [Bifidobacterium longum]|nr:hypothetical protein [Bifidobacterium longum]